MYDFHVGESETKGIDLVELTVWPPRQGERTRLFPLWIDLRFDEQIIPHTDDWRVTVYLTGAELFAELKGCCFEAGTLYGDDPLPASDVISEKQTQQSDFSANGQILGRIGVGLLEGVSAGFDAELGGKAQTQTKTERERNTQLVRRRVIARPNGRWELVELRGPLDGTYLRIPSLQEENASTNPDCVPLCLLNADADNFSVTLTLMANPEHITPDITPLTKASRYIWHRSAKAKPNKAAIIKRLVAMACTKRFRRPNDQRVPLARAVLTGQRIASSTDR